MNGWKNYETWNVSLWLTNDEGYYELAQECNSYQEFTEVVAGGGTPDSISWSNTALDHRQLDGLIKDMKE